MRSNISRSPFNSTGPSAPLRPNGGKPSEVFFIVGVGASAGGLEAFTQLLRALPIDTGMAFVFVQHLDPHHESALPTLLSKATPMSVVEVGDRTPVEPNTVYVLPPNKEINLVDGVLTLSPRPTEGPRMTIDLFFASLAESRAEKSVGVLLSGTGSDGISGLQAIHSHGGLTLVQDPPSAKYDGMPRGAIEAGCADFVLSPADIARELARIARHRHENEPSGKRKAEDGDPLQKIFSVLRKEKGIDFSHYKRGTIERRIQRRMFLLKIETLRDYADFLKDNRDEARSLCSDLLIRVTRFFRDEAAFRVLTDRIFPEILRHKPPDEPFRIWVPGCSNGEEVYSLAMCLIEFLGDKVGRFPIQIFGTDVSESALENARAGLYPESIESDVSPERLRRFFTKKGGRWQIVKSLRDTCVFARQDILKDPPFSRVDLVSCRNVLIYLAPAMQKRALAVFHFALNPAGYILFGTSEAPGPAADLFGVVDPKWKIYSKKPVPPRQIFDFALSPRLSEKGAAPAAAGPGGPDLRKQADRVLLDRYAPAGVIVNQSLEILEFRGDTSPYLRNAPGEPSRHLLKMVNEDIASVLAAAFRKEKALPFRKSGLTIEHGRRTREVSVEAIPFVDPVSRKRCWAVMFEPVEYSAPVAKAGKKSRPRKGRGGKADRTWKQELASTKAHLQSVIEEREAANEELQTSNEEVLSSNEELQSLNEELQTAKEELQATNEELSTVNDQLRRSSLETVSQMNDLHNFIESARVPIIMVDNGLRIRLFTPQVQNIFHLIPADIGRPLADIASKLNVDDLPKRVSEVIDAVSPREREVQDQDGRWHLLDIRPYKTLDRKIDGAIIVLQDIDGLKRAAMELVDQRDYAEEILSTMREPFVILNGDLRVKQASPAFYRAFKVSPEETEGRLLYELGNGQWNIPRLRDLLDRVLREQKTIQDFELEHDFESIGRRIMSLNAVRVSRSSGKEDFLLLGIEDVTERTRAQESMKKLAAGLEDRVKRRTAELSASNAELEAFSYSVAHNLRTPLREVSGFAQVLLRGYGVSLDETATRYLDRITAGVKQMARLVDDLLNLSRLSHGEMRTEKVDLSLIAETVVSGLRKRHPERRVDVKISPGMEATADAGLIHVVLENLLDNAWKFTGKKSQATVEFGVIRKDGKNVYFVRDNGAGFDMAYIDKLFGPFQRLHTINEFPGTGVGLAIVQRVIRRHGGRVWAEGEVEQGATFYFTLPPEETPPPENKGTD